MNKRKIFCALGFLMAFGVWTAILCMADVRAIGPRESKVGLAHINQFVHGITGVHFSLYILTDWLGLVPVFVGFGFAVFGLSQWIQRKSIRKVDGDILLLGGFYLVMLAAYLFFEAHPVNYRPVLIEGFLEASYPSSTTLLVLCVMPAAMMQWKARIASAPLRKAVIAAAMAFTAFTVGGRLLSGVHWLSDIVGGALLSAGLVQVYAALAFPEKRKETGNLGGRET